MSGVCSSRSLKTAAKEAAKYNADPYVTGMQERSVTLNKQKNLGFLWKWRCKLSVLNRSFRTQGNLISSFQWQDVTHTAVHSEQNSYSLRRDNVRASRIYFILFDITI